MIPADTPGIVEAAISTLVASVVWLVRLESKTIKNEKDLAAKSVKDDLHDDRVNDSLLEIKLSQARIETTLGIKKHES